MNKRYFAACFVLCSSLLVASVQARDNRLDLSLGAAQVSNGSFDNSAAVMGSYTFLASPIEFSAGLLFAPEFSTENDAAALDVTSVYLAAGHEFEFNSFFFGVQAGVAQSYTRAEIEERSVGDDQTTGAMGLVSVGYKINQTFGLRSGVLYLNDVSGAEISVWHIGTRWTF